MRTFMTTTAVLAALLLTSSAGAAQVSIGIRIGPPPPPRVLRVQPARPGPEFIWIAGYWYPVGRRYRWHEGYWTRPPYAGARWIEPRSEHGRFYEGYWDGDRGRLRHDHDWDRRKNRDYNRFHPR